MFGLKISSRFIAAVLGAAAIVANDFHNPQSWLTAITAIFAASAPGVLSSKQ